MQKNIPKPHEIVKTPSPFCLAENLDSDSINEIARRDQVRGAYNASRKAWHPVELLLADAEPDGPLDVRIEEGFLPAAYMAEHARQPRSKMKAQMFLANLDLLALRGHGRPIDETDIMRSYQMMANVLADSLGYFADPDLHTTLAEMTTYALIARHADPMNVPFIASPREARSKERPQENHNLYTVDDNVTIKTALRVWARYGKNETPSADSFVSTFYSEGFLTSNSRDLDVVNEHHATEPDKTLNQIIAELIVNEPYDGYKPDSPEANGLSTISARLVKYLNAHRRKILGLPSLDDKAGPTIRSMAARSIVPSSPIPKSSPLPQPSYSLPTKGYFTTYHGRRFVNPYLQAESIPPEVLEQLTFWERDSKLIGSLWRTIELGLTTSDSARVIAAAEEAGNIAANTTVSVPDRIVAAMISANGELFARRVAKQRATGEDIKRSFYAMAGVLSNLRQGEYGTLDERVRKGVEAELISYCLVSYNADDSNVPYLGSNREERSPLKIANHDIYTMSNKDGASKVAAQVKHSYHAQSHQLLGSPSKLRRTFMTPVFLADLLAAESDTPRSRDNLLNHAASLVLDAAENDLSDQDAQRLQRLAGAALKLFVDQRKFLKQNSKYHKMPYTSDPPEKYIAGL